ncbi:hypothetical protein [Microtetraspora malaysiensis]|uniref:Uncharacterized protein n=1 Tax=Microtetraspora malaysiensis TaxID=161358 RepID=A0ABW6T5P9_9ACTN
MSVLVATAFLVIGAALESEMTRTQQAITFLQHTVECRHRFLDDCPDCTAFSRTP